MQFLSSIVGGVGSRGLPYELIEGTSSDLQAGWKLHEGRSLQSVKSKSHVSPTGKVTVFTFDKKIKENLRHLATAQNFFKRMKTLRHPQLPCEYYLHIERFCHSVSVFIEGLETDKNYTIVTEHLRPLSSWIAENVGTGDAKAKPGHKAAISWGVHCLLRAMKFINQDCSLIHGNVSPESIFVSPGGDWKLAGFYVIDALDQVEKGPSSLLKENTLILDHKYQSPERLHNNWMGIAEPLWNSDVWSFGCVLYECINGKVSDSKEYLNTSKLPSFLRKIFTMMLSSDPHERPSPEGIYQSKGFQRMFKNKFVNSMVVLEEIQLKTKGEKQFYFKEMLESIEAFPEDACKYKILPQLYVVLQNFQSMNSPDAADSAVYASMLGPILKIGGRITDKDEFNRLVVPPLMFMFGCNDRSIRVTLLQKLDSFIHYLDPEIINEKLFPSISTGFGDTTPILRELTLKSMLHVAPKLNKANLNDKLMKYLVNLQNDVEPSIRTNTVICMSRIASYTRYAMKLVQNLGYAIFSAQTRKKLIVGAFTKAVRQNFVHTRIAGVRAIHSTYAVLLDSDIHELTSKVLPSLCLLLNDPVTEVRNIAFSTTRTILDNLEKISKEKAIQEMESVQEKKSAEATEAEAKQEDASTKQVASSTKYLSQAAGWAFSGLSKQWNSSSDADAITEPKETKLAEETPKPATENSSISTPKSSSVVMQLDKPGWGSDDDYEIEDDFCDTFDIDDDKTAPLNRHVAKPTKELKKAEQKKENKSSPEKGTAQGTKEERKKRLEKRRADARTRKQHQQKLNATKFAKEALKNDDFFSSF